MYIFVQMNTCVMVLGTEFQITHVLIMNTIELIVDIIISRQEIEKILSIHLILYLLQDDTYLPTYLPSHCIV